MRIDRRAARLKRMREDFVFLKWAQAIMGDRTIIDYAGTPMMLALHEAWLRDPTVDRSCIRHRTAISSHICPQCIADIYARKIDREDALMFPSEKPLQTDVAATENMRAHSEWNMRYYMRMYCDHGSDVAELYHLAQELHWKTCDFVEKFRQPGNQHALRRINLDAPVPPE